MFEDEIIEGNKLIAEFMEYEEGFPNKIDRYGYVQVVEGYIIPNIVNFQSHERDKDAHQFPLIDLRFHSSWNWIMKVVEKIESLNCIVTIYSNGCSISSSWIFQDLNTKSLSKIELVWLSCTEFIKWYNYYKRK